MRTLRVAAGDGVEIGVALGDGEIEAVGTADSCAAAKQVVAIIINSGA